MGTNYYHRFNQCQCCGRYDERHICKSMTSFRGYKRAEWLVLDDEPYDEILSWADWRTRLRAGGEVWSEYGYQIDTEQFIRDVQATPRATRRRQYDEAAKSHYAFPYDHDALMGDSFDDRHWLDPEGYSFYDGEFC